MNSLENNHFAQSTLPVTDDALQMIYKRTWEKVAEKAIGEIALEQVRREFTKTCEDFVMFTFEKENKVEGIAKEEEVRNVRKDEWANFLIGVGDRHQKQQNGESKNDIEAAISNPSQVGRRLTLLRKPTMEFNKSIVKEIFVKLEPDEESDDQEEKLRLNYLTEERKKLLTKAELMKRQAFLRSQQEKKEKQIVRNSKPITFDYNGRVINFGKSSAAKKPLYSTIKYKQNQQSMKIQKEGVIVKKVTKRAQTESISKTSSPASRKQITRADSLNEVEFQPNGQKDILQNISLIEKGVRIIELRGDKQTVKENKTKQKYDKNFLNYRLREFKDYIKDKKFREHTIKLRNIESRQKLIRNSIQSQKESPESKKNMEVSNIQSRVTISKKSKRNIETNVTNSEVQLPELSYLQNKKSQKSVEDNKSRAKSLKTSQKSIFMNQQYRNPNRSFLHRRNISTHSNTISVINQPIYNQAFISTEPSQT